MGIIIQITSLLIVTIMNVFLVAQLISINANIQTQTKYLDLLTKSINETNKEIFDLSLNVANNDFKTRNFIETIPSFQTGITVTAVIVLICVITYFSFPNTNVEVAKELGSFFTENSNVTQFFVKENLSILDNSISDKVHNIDLKLLYLQELQEKTLDQLNGADFNMSLINIAEPTLTVSQFLASQ
jgi:hypothetical protein